MGRPARLHRLSGDGAGWAEIAFRPCRTAPDVFTLAAEPQPVMRPLAPHMNQETVTYLTNIVIGFILAALATHYWASRRGSNAMPVWVLAAWIMTLADALFAARPILPHPLGRLLPTLSVTIGHAVLFLGAQWTANQKRSWSVVSAVVLLHAAGLIGFLFVTQPSNWRMVFNALIWGGFSLMSARVLRQASPHFWQSLVAPATVFLVHGVFHGTRAVLATTFEANGWSGASEWLQIVGDLEVSFFMVALFVGLLVANLQLRHEELLSAQAEVQTLSGLLPMCAWCKKVRDDEGYWEQVEDYFSRRSQIKFTHGVCVECLETMKGRGMAVPAPAK